MSFGEAVRAGFRNWSDFGGRASRTEYWLWTLAMIGIYLLLTVVVAAADSSILALALVAWVVIVFIPTLSIFVRRLHDVGRSGWWWLIGIIPFGSFVLLVFTFLDSTPGPNRWGPPPRGSSFEQPSTWRVYAYGPPAGWGTATGPQPGWGAPTPPPPGPGSAWGAPPSTPPGPPSGWGSPTTSMPTQPIPAWQQAQQAQQPTWAPPVAPPPPPTAWTPPAAARACATCGLAAPAGAAFCARCGGALPPA